MKLKREKLVEKVLLVVACSTILSLMLIAVFMLKEGVPFLLKVGLRRFLFSSEWQPRNGQYGIYPMIVASLWVTVGALLVGGPLGIAGAIFLTKEMPAGPVKQFIDYVLGADGQKIIKDNGLIPAK